MQLFSKGGLMNLLDESPQHLYTSINNSHNSSSSERIEKLDFLYASSTSYLALLFNIDSWIGVGAL